MWVGRTAKLNTVNWHCNGALTWTTLYHCRRINFSADRNKFPDFLTPPDPTRPAVIYRSCVIQVRTWSGWKRTTEHRSDRASSWYADLSRPQSSSDKHLLSRDLVPGSRPSSVRCSRACPAAGLLLRTSDSSDYRLHRQLTTDHAQSSYCLTVTSIIVYLLTSNQGQKDPRATYTVGCTRKYTTYAQ